MPKDKVLFVGHYRERSGWGKAGRGYIHAMQAAGLDVAARPILLNQPVNALHTDIIDAEENPSYGARVLIQNVLPTHMEYDGSFEKCVGLVPIDTFDIEKTEWLDRLEMMDEVWTMNGESTRLLKRVLDKPVRTIPCAFDTTVFGNDYGRVTFKQLPDNIYKFYTIVDNLNRRKNLPAIIKAFHLAFPRDYPVALVIKATQRGATPDAIFDEVNKTTESIKSGLRIYRHLEDYHNEIVISDEVPEEGIYALHQSCDTYVSASYAEGFCIPAFEAMAFGKTVIAPRTGGPIDYLGKGHYLVDGRLERVFGMMNTLDGLFTGNERWFNVDIDSLVTAMQDAYNNRTTGEANVERFSYKRVGEKIKRAIH